MRRARRWALRAMALVVLAALVGILVIFHVPFSSSLLDRQIRERFALATDLDISFQQATFHLARTRLDLTNVRLFEPGAKHDLVQSDDVRLYWRWRPLSFGSPARLVAVEIEAPAPQRAYWSNATPPLQFDDRLTNLNQIVRRVGKRSHVSPGGGASHALDLRIMKLDFYLHAGSPDSPGPRIVGLEGATLDFRREPGGYWRLHAQAHLAGPSPEPSVRLTVRPRPQRGVYGLEAEWDRFLTRERIRLPERVIDLSIPATRVGASVGTSLSSPTLSIRAAHIRALDSRMRLSGRIDMARPHAFRVRTELERIAPAALNWALEAGPQPLVRLPMLSGHVAGHMEATGDLRSGVNGSALCATLSVRNLTMRYPYAPAALGPLDFDARLATGTLELDKVSLSLGDSQLQGRGRLSGLFARADAPTELRAFWTADARLHQLIEYLPQGARDLAEKWQPSGAAWGSGTIDSHASQAQWQAVVASLSDPAIRLKTLLQTIQVDGQARLDGVSVRLPRLHAPVRELTGRITVANDSLAFSQIEGRLLGSRIRLSGQVLGDPLVIDAPQLRADIDGRISLERAPQWLGEADRQRWAPWRPTGTVALDLFAHGPLHEPRRIEMEGTAQGRNLGAQLDFPLLKGRISQAAVDLKIGPGSVALQNASGMLDTMHWSTTATLGRDGFDISLNTRGEAETLQRIVSPIPQSWRLEGPVGVSALLRAEARKEGAYPCAGTPLRNLMEYLQTKPDATAWLRDFEWQPDGYLTADGCILRQPHMPAPVTDIRGRLEFDLGGLRTAPELDARWGSSQTRTRGGLEIDQDGLLRLNFDIHAPVAACDEWFRMWRYRPHNRQTANRPLAASPTQQTGDAPTWPEKRPRPIFAGVPLRGLRIAGAVHASTATLRRFKMRDASMQMQYMDDFEKQGRLWLDTVACRLYGGRCQLENFVLDVGTRPRTWQITQVRLQDVECAPFLLAATGRPSKMTGRLSGALGDLGANLGDTESLSGQGEFEILGSSFQENALFSALGKAIRSKELSAIAETDIAGEFTLADGMARVPRLRMRASLIQMDANGRVGFDGRLDLTVMYRLFGELRLPLVKTVMGAIEHLGSYIFKVHVGGTLENPKIKPVPFSIDKVPGFRDPWFGQSLESAQTPERE